VPRRVAMITGITGQDGSWLARQLVDEDVEVHGLVRRTSTRGTARIEDLLATGRVTLHSGDLSDATSLATALSAARPDEIYNLAAQSDVHESFAAPLATSDVTGLGAMRLLDAATRVLGPGSVRYYQASTSELYGVAPHTPQDERTPFAPRSPYAVAKLFAHHATVLWREAYGLFACCGILFNHESPGRGEGFVTRKVAMGAAGWARGRREPLQLGNLDARRDWGHARDHVRAMTLMLRHDRPDDYVIATGVSHSVRDLVTRAYGVVGVDVGWEGHGVEERGVERQTGRVVVEVSPRFFRPADVAESVGDASKARRVLGWAPTVPFDALVEELVRAELARAEVAR
jgi:GDPmannose 4,6-dehydratase